MSATRFVSLVGKVPDAGSVSFIRAELTAETGSPFAIVYYTLGGIQQAQGLRLDLGKRAFFDSTGDQEADDQLPRLAPDILEAIGEEHTLQFGRSPSRVRILEAIDLDGVFWLPSQESRRVHGTLSYSPEDSIRLRLADELSPNKSLLLGSLDRYPLIYASFADGSIATLIDCFTTHRSISTFGGGSTKILANRSLFGAHVSSLTLAAFGQAHFKVTSLEGWLDTASFSHKYETNAAGKMVVGFEFEQPDPVVLEIPVANLQLQLRMGVSSKTKRGDLVEMSRHASMTVTATEPREIDEWLTVGGRIQNLLALLVGEAVNMEELSLGAPVGVASDADHSSHCSLLITPRGKSAERHLMAAEMLLPWSAIRDNAERILDKWFRLYDQASQALNIFFEVAFDAELLVDDKLVWLTSALEIFHRSTTDSEATIADSALFKHIVQGTLDSLAGHLANGASDRLRAQLANANQIPLEDRLTALFSQLPSELQADLTRGDATFLERVVAHRHELLHGGSESARRSYEGTALYRATERLRVFFMALLMVGLGIEPGSVRQILKRKNWINWALYQDLATDGP